jgi:hypothetical protein
MVHGFLFHDESPGAKAVLPVGKGAFQDNFQLFRGKRLEDQHPAAGEKGGNDLEGRVFRGGADQGQQAAFDMGQKGILLGFVEAVYFINKEDSLRLVLFFALFGPADYFPYFLSPREDGGKKDKIGFHAPCQDSGKGGFAAAGRAPQQQRGNFLLPDQGVENPAFVEKVFLADKIGQLLRPHPFG